MNEPAGVFLRALEPTDLDRVFEWHNDAKLYATLGTVFRAVSKSSEAEWLRRKSEYSTAEVNLAICLQDNGEHVGNIYLRDIDWTARKAALHLFIGSQAHRRKGYGRAAIRQLLAHAFLDLNLNRVYLEVLADNQPAIAAYEKCGFRPEGTLRQHVFKGGAYKDVVVMGVCAADFRQMCSRT